MEHSDVAKDITAACLKSVVIGAVGHFLDTHHYDPSHLLTLTTRRKDNEEDNDDVDYADDDGIKLRAKTKQTSVSLNRTSHVKRTDAKGERRKGTIHKYIIT